MNFRAVLDRHVNASAPRRAVGDQDTRKRSGGAALRRRSVWSPVTASARIVSPAITYCDYEVRLNEPW